MISFDFASVASCPRTISFCAEKALTTCTAFSPPIPELQIVFPSKAIIPPIDFAIFCVHEIKHFSKDSGLTKRKNLLKVSCEGMPLEQMP